MRRKAIGENGLMPYLHRLRVRLLTLSRAG